MDNRNLTNEWLDKYNNSAVVWNRDALNAIDPDKVDHLLGKTINVSTQGLNFRVELKLYIFPF